MMRSQVLPAAAYEKVNKESEVDKTLCIHLEDYWSNHIVIGSFHIVIGSFMLVMSTGGLLEG